MNKNYLDIKQIDEAMKKLEKVQNVITIVQRLVAGLIIILYVISRITENEDLMEMLVSLLFTTVAIMIIVGIIIFNIADNLGNKKYPNYQLERVGRHYDYNTIYMAKNSGDILTYKILYYKHIYMGNAAFIIISFMILTVVFQ